MDSVIAVSSRSRPRRLSLVAIALAASFGLAAVSLVVQARVEEAEVVRVTNLLPNREQVANVLWEAGEIEPVSEVVVRSGGSVRDAQHNGTRPGLYGVREFVAGSDDVDGHLSQDLILSLYPHESVDEATAFWRQYPPEVAHAGTAPNLADQPDAARWLDMWRVSWDPGLPSSEGEAICLGTENPRGASSYCRGFYAWVRLCTWTVELRITFGQPAFRPLNDPMIRQQFDGVTRRMAEALGCE
jgi:hypothetical protein